MPALPAAPGYALSRGFVRLPGLLLLLSGLLWMSAVVAQPPGGYGYSPAARSTLEIPLRISLTPLFDAAEDLIPQQAGNWRGWKDWHGIKTRYRAWRGPLSIHMQGDVLRVEAHIRYWIRAQKKILNALTLKTGCGIDEPPRQAIIGMQVRLGWGADWSLRPDFRILPTRFLDRCEVTVADIDVTPLVEKEFRRQMQNSLRSALRTIAPRVAALRQQAQRTWSLLQEPLQIGEGHWLLLKPGGVALSPLSGYADNLDTNLAITLYPELVTGTMPATQPAPLPPLGRYYPRAPGLNLQLAIELDFADLGRRLSATLAGRSFTVKGQQAGISQVEVGGSGEQLRGRVHLTGDLAGTLEITTRVAYKAQQLRLEKLEHTYDPDDPAIALLATALHDRIREALETEANALLQQYLEQLKVRLGVLFEKLIPAGVNLDMSTLQLRTLRLQVTPRGIRLDGTAAGSARLGEARAAPAQP